jgi:hypothetical protein
MQGLNIVPKTRVKLIRKTAHFFHLIGIHCSSFVLVDSRGWNTLSFLSIIKADMKVIHLHLWQSIFWLEVRVLWVLP